MHALVISFDRLPIQFLACYGNSWIETPHFDRLAARAVVFDQHFTRYIGPAKKAEAQSTLIESLAAAGIRGELFLEQGAERPNAPAFPAAQVHECGGEQGLDAQPKRTPVAAAVDAALQSLERLLTNPTPSSLTWVQSRGVPIPWLAPRDYATLYLDLVDEETPEEQTESTTANNVEEDADSEIDVLEIEEEEERIEEPEEDLKLIDFSRDEFDRFLMERSTFPADESARRDLAPADRRIIRSLYGGYVTLLDRELGRLLDIVEKMPDDQPMLVLVTAARGEQLDDITMLRGRAALLSDEVVHTPLMIWERSGEESDIGSRRQCLVQTIDLGPTLTDWFGLPSHTSPGEGQSLLPIAHNEKSELRDMLVIESAEARAIRTCDHYLIAGSGECGDREASADPTLHLFAKPEDFCEANDVAGQSPELVESLLGQLNECCDTSRANHS